MKAAPLLVQWHNDGTPIFSAHFEPHGKGRLATAGGDNNVRVSQYSLSRIGESVQASGFGLQASAFRLTDCYHHLMTLRLSQHIL
jgi:hypothetical protein